MAGATSLVISVTAACVRFPQPRAHDEFCYLLAADTFAEGRLTNPTHPTWHFFESFHIIHEPSYMAKYPPGQGLFLALGQVIWHPIVGVWISTALAVTAICWMLQSWVPSRWAFFGAMVAAIHPALHLRWGTQYWGGAVALLGGALVLGAMRRIEKDSRPRDAIWLAIGAAILANSRPLEGLALCLGVGARFAWTVLWQRRSNSKEVLRTFVVPFGAVILAALAWMGYYNWRVTGDPGKMPYAMHEDTYMMQPVFVWQDLRKEPNYRHDVMRSLYVDLYVEKYYKKVVSEDYLKTKLSRFYDHELKQFFGFPIVLLAGCSLLSVRTRTTQFLLALLTWVHLVHFLCVAQWAHYLAPVFPAVFLLAVQGARCVAVFIRRNGLCRIAFLIGWFVLYLATIVDLLGDMKPYGPGGFRSKRPGVIARLSEIPGNHLVICRYASTHDVNAEYVYNRANIDGAKVVWAREMSPEENRKLLEYFQDRTIWLFQPERQDKLEPYPAALNHGGPGNR